MINSASTTIQHVFPFWNFNGEFDRHMCSLQAITASDCENEAELVGSVIDQCHTEIYAEMQAEREHLGMAMAAFAMSMRQRMVQ